MNSIEITDWIAYRTWESHNGQWLSVITNERNHEILRLDDETSQIWRQIELRSTYADILKLATELEVESSLDEFLEELHGKGLIKINGNHIFSDQEFHVADAVVHKKLEDADNTELEYEIMDWVAKNGFLHAAHWEVTYRCNERCVHCYNPGASHTEEEKSNRKTDELTFEEAVSLLDDMVRIGVFRLILSGGEVMLRRDFWELVAEARKRGFSLNIYTNGQKLDKATCQRLASYWPSSVGISIYSADEKTHDEITRLKGSHKKSVLALKYLNDLGIKTYLKCTQMDHTLRSFQDVKNLANELGAGAELDMTMSSGADGASAPMLLAPQNPKELILLAVTEGSPLFVGDETINYSYVDKDFDSSVCGASVSILGIDPMGGVNTCNSMPLSAGNHRTHGLYNIWTNSALHMKNTNKVENSPLDISNSEIRDVVAPLSRWQQTQLKHFHECGTHRRCGWCDKCPGLAMLEHGDPLAPSTVNCRTATARMIGADLLASGKTRDQIADELELPRNFGLQQAIEMPTLKEERRGTGFNPALAGIEALKNSGCGSCSSNSCSQKLTSSSGKVLLNNGTLETRKALQLFDKFQVSPDLNY